MWERGEDDELASPAAWLCVPWPPRRREPRARSLRATASNPGATWETVKLAAVRLDAKKLQEIASLAEVGKSNCLVVVRHGKLAGEWYFRETDQNTAQEVASETKSFASTLVGIAQDHGDLRIGKSASTWIPQWKGTPAAAVTVRDLLSNDSGREWSLALDGSMISSRDWTSFGVGLQQRAAPGTVWEYANTAIQTLQRVLQNATGQEVTAFAQQRLFRPLGMTHTKMSTDSSGNAEMFLGVQSTCRDLARFGVLMLNRGQWNGKQDRLPQVGGGGHRATVDEAQRRIRLPLVA